MKSLGYLCQQHSVRFDRPVKAYDRWVNRIPSVYRQAVLNETNPPIIEMADDPFCLATIRHYRSLVPMAQEFRKPIFHLTAADGAIGSHANAVRDAARDFRNLALKISSLMEESVKENFNQVLNKIKENSNTEDLPDWDKI